MSSITEEFFAERNYGPERDTELEACKDLEQLRKDYPYSAGFEEERVEISQLPNGKFQVVRTCLYKGK